MTRSKNVAVIVKNAIENSIKSKSDVIAIDLRYYKEIGLGNIIFSNIADENLEDFKESSKFNQLKDVYKIFIFDVFQHFRKCRGLWIRFSCYEIPMNV